MGERPFLTARWHNLVMINYEVDASVLSPFVPSGTTLDLWQGRAFASVVGFQFLDTRVLGVPIPFHRDFEEINLRFYVLRDAGGEERRGVVFIREIVPRRAIAWTARAIYNEPYLALPMRHQIATGTPLNAAFSWRLAGRWHTIGVEAHGPASLPAPGSLEEFISEHYWGYTQQRDGSTIEYQVAHPQWPVSAGSARISADLEGVYGERLASHLQEPSSCFIAPGAAITVFRPVRLSGT